MKGAIRIIGLVGAAVAILWAMRDRLISIAAPADPEPPRFRVIPPADPTPGPTSDDDLTEISGIGPVFAARLREAGITTFAGLVQAGSEEVAEVTGAADSRVEDWLGQASARI